jgi:PKD repeat protein
MTRSIAVGLLACGLTLQGCNLTKVEKPASLNGPSELGISLQMLAIPDIVVADGIQTAVIQAVVRDSTGTFAAGMPIVFTIEDEQGRTAEIGTLTSAAGARVYGATTITTNSNGIAQVVYTTPERRDFTADSRIIVGARPVGTDANGAPFTTLRLQIKSAEPRRFPQSGDANVPTCQFAVSPNNPFSPEGTVLRFSSTSFVTNGFIVRYEWYFGDGTSADGEEGIIEIQHPYPLAGSYTVTHIVTSNSGIQASCTRPITIIP